jgi:homoserine O-acetyltransferase
MASSTGTITQPLAATSPEPTYEGDFVLNEALVLDCGRVLTAPVLHYAVYGRLNEVADNAVLVCHALSGSALAGVWWPGLFDGIVDLEQECVICVNLLGSCYGSTGPGSVNPESQAKNPLDPPEIAKVYGPEFPLISIGDNVRAQAQLLDSLGISRLKLAIGGSIGGMQALDWTIRYPERVERAVIIAVAPLGAMGLALNHLQRTAIQGDPEWLGGWYALSKPGGQSPRRGMALARQIAMLSYKSSALFDERFGRNPNRNGEDPWALDAEGGGLIVSAAQGRESGGRFDVAGFLDYQGERFLERFDANAYLAILRTMDTWEPTRGYRDAQEAYGRITASLTFVGISSDWLFPEGDVRKLAETVEAAGARVVYQEMVTDHGHDAFLAEQGELVRLLAIGSKSGQK